MPVLKMHNFGLEFLMPALSSFLQTRGSVCVVCEKCKTRAFGSRASPAWARGIENSLLRRERFFMEDETVKIGTQSVGVSHG